MVGKVGHLRVCEGCVDLVVVLVVLELAPGGFEEVCYDGASDVSVVSEVSDGGGCDKCM